MKCQCLVTMVVFAGFTVGVILADETAQWQQFRGPGQASLAIDADLPLEFSATSDGESHNIAWKASLPGKAASSPIVVNNRVIVTSASGYRHDRLHVAAFDVDSGEKLWHRQFWATGRTETHPFSSVAANTPASDGESIYAFFSSNDLVCLDTDGNLKWLRGLTHDYPTAANDVGMSASPVVIGDVVIVQVENEVNSFAMGIAKQSGKELWKIERPKQMNWVSPTAYNDGEQTLVLLQNGRYLSANHPQTGKEVWRFAKGCSTIVSPTIADGDVFARSGDGIVRLVRKGTTGEVEVAWSQAKLSPNAASPIVHGNKVYTVNRSGVVACADAVTGEVAWQLRLKGPFWATPVLADKYLYCFNHEGLCQVVDISGDKGKVVASNQLDDLVLGSPAVVDDAMYVRGENHVWKIAN